MIEMLDAVRNGRHWQKRRQWDERIGRQVYAGADRTIIVPVLAGVLGGKRFRTVCALTDRSDCSISPLNRIEMRVPEGKGKLN